MTIEQLRAAAKTLRTQSAEQGIEITHSAALHTVARQHGFENWNAAYAVLKAAPRPFTKEDGVRLLDALSKRQRATPWAQLKPDERLAFLDDADAVLGILNTVENDRLAVALGRYAFFHLKIHADLKLEKGNSFATRLKDSDGFWGVGDAVDPLEEFFPELVKFRNQEQRQRISYREIVLTMNDLITQRIDITADEIIEHFKLDGRCFNENTVRDALKGGLLNLRAKAIYLEATK